MDGRDRSARLTQNAAQQPPPAAVFAESANTDKPSAFTLPFDAEVVRESCRTGARSPDCARFGGVGELLAAIMTTRLEGGSLPLNPNIQSARQAMSNRVTSDEARQHSVRTKRFKLVQAPRVNGGVQRALFDLESDLSETKDVSHLHPEILRSLSDRLDQWLKTLPQERTEELDASDIEMLRKLGYGD